MSNVSKFMSLVLRHAPEEAGLSLDSGGWANLAGLVTGMNSAGYPVSSEDLLNIVATSDKKRFSLSENGLRIRAAQGHSIPVNLGLEPKQPPKVLFHGTAEKNISSILEQGIKSGQRQQVHLSADRETAFKVGQRHGRPVVISVASQEMSDNGICFWQSDNAVWLVDWVPSEYLTVT